MNHFKKIFQESDPRIKITVTDEEVGTTEFTSQGKKYETPLYKMLVEGYDIEGNPINEEFAVSRFGVKNGKVQSLEAGYYTISEYKKMSTGIMGFRIKGPYFFHLQSNKCCDTNFGCLAISKGISEWIRFEKTIAKAGWNLPLEYIASNALINVNIMHVQQPNIKFK